MYSKLAPGNKAHDFKFKTPWDDEVKFYDAVGNNPAVLIFSALLRMSGLPNGNGKNKTGNPIWSVKKEGGYFVVLQSAPETVASLIKKDDFLHYYLRPSRESFPTLCVEAGGIIKYLHPAV